MNIALDFDGTYTADPKMWVSFIKLAKESGHQVYIVTFRSSDQTHDQLRILSQGVVKEVVFTSGYPKRKFMDARGTPIDIWIDDQPELIVF